MYHSVKDFFHELLYEPHHRTPVDVYTTIFLCDFINIFVFIFAFTVLNVSFVVDTEYRLVDSTKSLPSLPYLLLIFTGKTRRRRNQVFLREQNTSYDARDIYITLRMHIRR